MLSQKEIELLQKLRKLRQQHQADVLNTAKDWEKTYGVSHIILQYLIEQALVGSDTLSAEVQRAMKRR